MINETKSEKSSGQSLNINNSDKYKEEVGKKLRKLFLDNKEFDYFCIERREKDGPVKCYFLNKPDSIYIGYEIGITTSLFDTYYNYSCASRVVWIKNNDSHAGYNYYSHEIINELIENKAITFLTKEVERQINEDYILQLKGQREKYEKEIQRLGFKPRLIRFGLLCDICGSEVSSSSGYPLVHCRGKKMCPDCFQKWQKGIVKI